MPSYTTYTLCSISILILILNSSKFLKNEPKNFQNNEPTDKLTNLNFINKNLENFDLSQFINSLDDIPLLLGQTEISKKLFDNSFGVNNKNDPTNPFTYQSSQDVSSLLKMHENRNLNSNIYKLLDKSKDYIKYLPDRSSINYNTNFKKVETNSNSYYNIFNKKFSVHKSPEDINTNFKYNQNCRWHSCLISCKSSTAISIYLYPLVKNEDYSREFLQLYYSILHSEFYTDNPSSACFFLPNIDFLIPNLNKVKKLQNLQFFEQKAHLDEIAKFGSNHLLFTQYSKNLINLDIGNSIILAPDFQYDTFRLGYDVSIGTLNLLNFEKSEKLKPYKYLFGKFAVCKVESSHQMIQSLYQKCIPYLVKANILLPFYKKIDYESLLFRSNEGRSSEDYDFSKLNINQIDLIYKRGQNIYNYYFQNINRNALSSLSILNERTYANLNRNYFDWNNIAHVQKSSFKVNYRPRPPIYATQLAPDYGYTCVILAYDRIVSLVQVIERVLLSESLKKIIIVWNNQNKAPPSVNSLPKNSNNIPIVIIQSKENVLSNRFHPFVEIETEAVLAIDDDIVMLTKDELDFGYHTWREYPDRIVGFPSRLHVKLTDEEYKKKMTERKNGTSDGLADPIYRYESEWKNEYSMVLTGVAFYHSFYNYLYTFKTPKSAINFVNHAMNCEDILMNFVVSNATNLPPIKVSPRKKFKCTECGPGLSGAASVEPSHMVERSECINKFGEIYGYMPLKSINFRADPLLYKDDFENGQKRFFDMGEL